MSELLRDLQARFEPADVRAPRLARAAATAFARAHGLQAATVEDIALCVSEAVSNVVMHAYRDSETPGPVILEAHLAEDGLWIVVSDYGGGLKPRLDSPGLGLGIPLMGQLSTEIDFRTNDDGTEVRMLFLFG